MINLKNYILYQAHVLSNSKFHLLFKVMFVFFVYYIYLKGLSTDYLSCYNEIVCMKRSNPVTIDQEDPVMLYQLQKEIEELHEHINQLELRVRYAETARYSESITHAEDKRISDINQSYLMVTNKTLTEERDDLVITSGELAGTNLELRCDILDQAEEHNRVRTELELGKKLAEDELANLKKR